MRPFLFAKNYKIPCGNNPYQVNLRTFITKTHLNNGIVYQKTVCRLGDGSQ